MTLALKPERKRPATRSPERTRRANFNLESRSRLDAPALQLKPTGFRTSPRIQTKMKLSESTGKFEQQADRLANQVMAMPNTAPPRIQRMCSECEEELQRQPIERKDKEEPLQVKASGATAPEISSALQSRMSSLRGGGQPLPQTHRDFFEPRFAYDFRNVRIHAGPDAARFSAAIRARAFTMGRDIVFGQGEFAPHSSWGRRLLAHELTHVMQQGASTHSGVKAPSHTIQRAAVVDDSLCEGAEFPPAEVWFSDRVLARIRANESLMSFGSVGEPVALVQQALVAWGCDEGLGYLLPIFGVDGIFGSETRAAVKTFQLHQGIDVDGIVGPITMADLDRIIPGVIATCTPGTKLVAFAGGSVSTTMQNVCLPPGTPPLPLGKGCPTPSTSGVTGIHQALDNFNGRSNARFGVGEEVNLSFDSFLSKTEPPATKAEPHGGLEWVKTSGPGNLSDIDARAGTALFQADQNVGVVELELRVLAKRCAGSTVAEVSFEIVKPTDGVMEQVSGTALRHAHGTWSVGFLANVFLTPMDVSFSNIQFQEGAVSAQRTGWLSDHTPEEHPQGDFRPVDRGNSTTGCRVITTDEAWSGIKFPDFKPLPTFGAGTFLWEIPWRFRVPPGGTAEPFTKASQLSTSDQGGTATIEKKGVGPFTRISGDDSSFYF